MSLLRVIVRYLPCCVFGAALGNGEHDIAIIALCSVAFAAVMGASIVVGRWPHEVWDR